MESKLKFIEQKRAADRNRQLAVEHEALRRELLEGFDDVGKVTRERLAGFRLQENFSAITKRDATEPVPLRLVLPLIADGDVVDGAGFHRGDWRFHPSRERIQMTNDE